MKKSLVGLLISFALIFSASSVFAFPGVMQLATRSGFFANDFPDTAIFLQHLYMWSGDEYFDQDGNKQDLGGGDELHIHASFSRFIRPWHFGDAGQFQYILEGIVPYYNLSSETGDAFGAPGAGIVVSGVGDPLIYTQIGWNNPAKTTHLQFALVVNFPFGDEDVSLNGNAYALMPNLAFEQRMGAFKLDGSTGYWFNFDSLNDDGDAKGRDYYEANLMGTYTIGKFWAYVQGDYTKYRKAKDANGNSADGPLTGDGFAVAVAPGIGYAIQPTMTLDLKYTMDVDGENTLKGNAINLRYLWVW